MTGPAGTTHGRFVLLLVLSALILTVSGAIYVLVAQQMSQPIPIGPLSNEEEAARATAEARRHATLLTILLISALLILLFVVGAYLVIRVGQLVARERVGGKPTAYVDVWGSYRLTDEQIERAVGEPDATKPDDDEPETPNDNT